MAFFLFIHDACERVPTYVAREPRGAVLSVAWALGPVLRISVLHPVGLLKRLVGGSAATVTVKINACTIVFCPYHEHRDPHKGRMCSCATLVPPQRQQAKSVVSVRGRLGASALLLSCTQNPKPVGDAANVRNTYMGVLQAGVLVCLRLLCVLCPQVH